MVVKMHGNHGILLGILAMTWNVQHCVIEETLATKAHMKQYTHVLKISIGWSELTKT